MTVDELCILVKEWEPTDVDTKAIEDRIIKSEKIFALEEQEHRRLIERRKNDYYDI